jgi:hypothetical protein
LATRVPVQAKLAISQPGDLYEQEADHIADWVMRMPEPMLQRTCAACDAGGTSCPKCEEEKAAALQRKTEPGSSAVDATSPDNPIPRLGSGQPLETSTRLFMESRFGQDFSRVRIHADGEAAESARAFNALAYTVGKDVVFGAGRYAPGTAAGNRLLAHELTHVAQQRNGFQRLQRAPDPAPTPGLPDKASDKAAQTQAATLEKEILADPVYKKLADDSKARVWWIIAQAKTKPLGDARGQRNYYLTKLKVAITTPFKGTETGKAEYGCSPEAEKENREEVEKALKIEKFFWEGSGFENVEETMVATGTKKVQRVGEGGKLFSVDRSDPRNIRVQIKVKLNGKPEEVASIKKLEDAIERESHTKGYYLDIVFVDKSGPDIFEFTVSFCQWANSGNWASGPTTLSHEVHHALGLADRYDYIEAHADNEQMNVSMRLVWFAEQMQKKTGPRDPYSKMDTNSNPLLAEDVCAVAFPIGPDRQKCINARKDLDPSGIPPL